MSFSRETFAALSDVLGALSAASTPEAALQAALPKLSALFRSEPAVLLQHPMTNRARFAAGAVNQSATCDQETRSQPADRAERAAWNGSEAEPAIVNWSIQRVGSSSAGRPDGLQVSAARDRFRFEFRRPPVAIDITVQRGSPYSDDEAHLARLLHEHIGIALASDPSDPRGGEACDAVWELVVTPEGAVGSRPTTLAAVWERYFPGENNGPDSIPTTVGRWLRRQIAPHMGREAFGSRVAFSVATPGGRLRLQFWRAKEAKGNHRLCLSEERGAANYFRLRARNLTRRECEVVFWIAQGKRDVEMAGILGCSPRTIGKHVENVLAKLGAKTRLEASHEAQEWLGRKT